MFSDLLSSASFVLPALVFVAMLLLIEASYTLWRTYHGATARKFRERRAHAFEDLQPRSAGVLRRSPLSAVPALEGALRRLSPGAWLAARLQQGDLNWTLSAVLLTTAALVLLGWYLGGLTNSPFLFAPVAAISLGVLPFAYLMRRRSKRLSTLQRQFPDALDLMGRALRAGHAFPSALKMAGEELPDPIASEFRAVHDEITYGVSLQQALIHLSERIPVIDVRYFAVAVLVQRESGGNLTEILSNLSGLIRERFKLLAKVRVLSAEGRLSAWIIGILPFVLAAILNIFNPKFMSPLWTDPIGITIVQYVLTAMAFGAVVLSRITRIRV